MAKRRAVRSSRRAAVLPRQSGGHAGPALRGATHLAELQRLVGNRAVSRMLGGRENGRAGLVRRDPGGPGAPPKRPPVKGKRKEEERHIKDMALDRRPPTFAQIYMAVRDAQFETIFDGDLKRLDLSELQTLDSVAGRQIEFYSDLARKQRADPGFVPPEGVPDLVFKNLVAEFRKFRADRLSLFLKRSERRAMAPGLIGPWALFIAKQYGGKPIGIALMGALGAAWAVVQAELEGKAWEFTDLGIQRWGYLDPACLVALLAEGLDPTMSDEAAEAQMESDIVEAIRDNDTILPVKLAEALLSSGSGDPADTSNLVTRIEGIDKDIGDGTAPVHLKRVGAIPYDTGLPPAHENLIFTWLLKQSHTPGTVYAAYASYIQAGA